ncbi:MAG: type II toxin-antitoxin system VapC family toxin [Candidatus Bathyarchaeia archaeon]
MYLVDTNIFLEVLLSGSKRGECKLFLGYLRDGVRVGSVTDFSIHSIIVVMNQLGRRDGLKTFLQSLTAYRGLSIYPTSLADEIRAIDLAAETGLDMDDSLQYASALSTEAECIVSFDKHFDGLKIQRREPSELQI